MFRLFVPFRTWRLIMKMAVHYFLSSDFCFPFPIESKFKFIDFALNLLRKKEKSFPMRSTFRLELPYNPGVTRLFQIKKSISYKKAVPHVNPVSLIRCLTEVRTTPYTIIFNSHHTVFVLHRLCSRERFSLDGRKVIGFACITALYDWS